MKYLLDVSGCNTAEIPSGNEYVSLVSSASEGAQMGAGQRGAPRTARAVVPYPKGQTPSFLTLPVEKGTWPLPVNILGNRVI